MNISLFIPGPVDVRPEVLEKMAMPMIGHRTKDASKVQRSISDNLRKLMFTNEEILLSTTSGSGLMEGSVKSCTKKKVAVFSVGAFGDRWYKMCTANGIPADKFRSEDGKPTTPKMIEDALSTGEYDVITITHNETSTGITNNLEELHAVYSKYPDVLVFLDTVSSLGGSKVEVDKYGIDICIASTQKCLGLPPGLALCSFSKKALERAKTVENRGLYLDLVTLYDTIQKKDYQYPSTPSLSHMFALEYQLNYILNEEGLENRFARHKEQADIVRAWAKKYFDTFAEEGYESDCLTTVKNTREISVADLNNKLKEKGFTISNGYGDLKEKTFRIAHMADRKTEDLQKLLRTIEEILGL